MSHTPSESFIDFVNRLRADLPILLNDADPHSQIRIVYNPNKNTAEAGEILLGLGSLADAQGQPIAWPGVVLQHKGSPFRSSVR